MHTDSRTTRSRKGRLAGALLAMSTIAAGVAVAADANGVSAYTSNPTTRCETNSTYDFYANRWNTYRSVYFEPNIEVSMYMQQGYSYQSEKVEYEAWLVKWDGARWRWYQDSQGRYKSITGQVTYQSPEFPHSVSVDRAGYYSWYVYYKGYGIGASQPQHWESYAKNWCKA